MEVKNNVVGWFEIPVINMKRAIQFYEKVFGFKLSRNQMGELDMAWFPWVENGLGSGGSLVCHEKHYKSSADGVLVYLTAHSGDLSNELSRVEPAGGNVVIPRTKISEEHGYMAVFIDTEGNKVAMHSRQ